jgi:phosphosulfolactate phosphohydrolase-like enzyme
MTPARKVKIDALPESAYRHLERDAIVCIDAMLAGTIAVTALALGRRVFTVNNPEEAGVLVRRFKDPLLAIEGYESAPEGFDRNLGPVSLSRRNDVERPLVLVSPLAGLLANASGGAAVYIACFRNLAATAEALATGHQRVALLGAGYAGEQRCEDRIVAALVARLLIEQGFEPEDLTTVQEVASWAGADMALVGLGKSADYLRRQRREEELEFVLTRRDDLDLVCVYEAGEVRVAEASHWLRKAVPQPAGIASIARPAHSPEALHSPDKIIEFSRGARFGSARKSTL